MYDPSDFSLSDMAECSSQLRKLGVNAGSMEEVGRLVADFFYTKLVDRRTQAPSSILSRLFVTQDYASLPPDLRTIVEERLGEEACLASMKHLILLGTRGQAPHLNHRQNAGGYQAIPLASEEAMKRVPLTAMLLKQMGLDVKTIAAPDASLLFDLSNRTYNVYYVGDLLASPFVPPSDDLRLPGGAKSVVGFGGMLPTGDLFAFILISRQFIPRPAADLFEPLALSVKLSLLPFTGRVFDHSHERN